MDVTDLDRLTQHKLLTRDEERVLAERIQAGDQSALQELVACNICLVIYVVKSRATRQMPLGDCIDEGVIGLYNAARLFQPRGIKFSTYAVPHIRTVVDRAKYERSHIVHLPNYLQQLSRDAKKGKLELTPAQQGYVRQAYLAQNISIPLEDVSPRHWSTGSAISEEAQAVQLERWRTNLLVLLEKLPPDLRDILSRRYGLNGHKQHTLQQIGALHNMPRRGSVHHAVKRAIKALQLLASEQQVATWKASASKSASNSGTTG